MTALRLPVPYLAARDLSSGLVLTQFHPDRRSAYATS
jgi:hypothetical protein